MRSPPAWMFDGRSCGSGESGSSSNAFRGLTSSRAPAARGFSPPEVVVHVKALACELPATLGIPLSRMSTADVAAEARRAGLVAQVMTQPPYDEARRVFWIMDNGSSHRGAACVKRLAEKYPRIVPVHGPVHASWLNQIEIYFSILQRKVLTPNDFSSLGAVSERLFAFERHYEAIAKPFEWQFRRHDLSKLLDRIKTPSASARAAA